MRKWDQEREYICYYYARVAILPALLESLFFLEKIGALLSSIFH